MMRFLTALLFATQLSGCVLVRIDNPAPELKEVSLLPVIAESVERSQTWTNAFRTNLLRVDGIDRVVLTDYPVREGQPVPASYSQDELPIAETSQALIEVKVVDFDPYYPPSASVAVTVYMPSGFAERDDPGLDLDRQGAMPTGGFGRVAQHHMSFMLNLRTDDPGTAWELRKYACAQSDDDRGMEEAERILRVSSRFIDFVAFETLEECFRRMTELRDESEAEEPTRAEPTKRAHRE